MISRFMTKSSIPPASSETSRHASASTPPQSLDTQFLIACGTAKTCEDACGCQTVSTFASEMTKWFDPNYHYLVPEFRRSTRFKISASKIFDEFAEAQALGINAKPLLIGPVTYLSLGKIQEPGFEPFALLGELLGVYEEILTRLASQGASWIQIDEPILARSSSAYPPPVSTSTSSAAKRKSPGC